MQKHITQVTEIVRAVIQQTTGQDVELAPEDELLATGQLDSMAVLQVFLQLQEAFNVQISFDYLTQENFGSIQQISGFLSQLEDIDHAA